MKLLLPPIIFSSNNNKKIIVKYVCNGRLVVVNNYKSVMKQVYKHNIAVLNSIWIAIADSNYSIPPDCTL